MRRVLYRVAADMIGLDGVEGADALDHLDRCAVRIIDGRTVVLPRAHERATMKAAVRVDPDRCEAATFCQTIAPGHFRLGDVGISTVIKSEVSAQALADVEEAARTCPTGAIVIERS